MPTGQQRKCSDLGPLYTVYRQTEINATNQTNGKFQMKFLCCADEISQNIFMQMLMSTNRMDILVTLRKGKGQCSVNDTLMVFFDRKQLWKKNVCAKWENKSTYKLQNVSSGKKNSKAEKKRTWIPTATFFINRPLHNSYTAFKLTF